jgi:hypothetical protein
VTLSIGPALAVGSVLVCCGVLAAVWRRDRPGVLAAVSPLAAGAAVCFAAAGRFSGARDPETGHELAALALVVGLAVAVVGAAWTRGSLAR